MKKLLCKSYFIIICIVTLIISCSISTLANDDTYYIKLSVPHYNLTNDFDNESIGFLEKNDNISFVFPNDIDSKTGYGLTLGAIRRRLGGELSFFSIESKGTNDLTKYKADCDIQKINADLKFFLTDSEEAKFNPYILAGYSFTKITFDGAAADLSTLESGDVKISGHGINLGIGTTINLSSDFAIDASAVFNRTKINRANFLGEKTTPKGFSVFTNDIVYSVGMIYYF